jgi:hypothetical protein
MIWDQTVYKSQHTRARLSGRKEHTLALSTSHISSEDTKQPATTRRDIWRGLHSFVWMSILSLARENATFSGLVRISLQYCFSLRMFLSSMSCSSWLLTRESTRYIFTLSLQKRRHCAFYNYLCLSAQEFFLSL